MKVQQFTAEEYVKQITDTRKVRSFYGTILLVTFVLLLATLARGSEEEVEEISNALTAESENLGSRSPRANFAESYTAAFINEISYPLLFFVVFTMETLVFCTDTGYKMLVMMRCTLFFVLLWGVIGLFYIQALCEGELCNSFEVNLKARLTLLILTFLVLIYCGVAEAIYQWKIRSFHLNQFEMSVQPKLTV